MKILAVSDVELGFIYQPQIQERFSDVDIMISCGDLPSYYLEYMVSTLNVPMYYVNGNHVYRSESLSGEERKYPWGATNLHRKCVTDDTGVLLAGVEGSICYNHSPYQYTQSEMWNHVYRLVPRFLFNKMRYGRYLDIFVTHAPPWKIHDQNDLPHQGIKAFNWLIKVFKPVYHLHGHIHVYRNDAITKTHHIESDIINCYGYREIPFDMGPVLAASQKKPREKN
jgi:Icc-related predicted phosphoesterase